MSHCHTQRLVLLAMSLTFPVLSQAHVQAVVARHRLVPLDLEKAMAADDATDDAESSEPKLGFNIDAARVGLWRRFWGKPPVGKLWDIGDLQARYTALQPRTTKLACCDAYDNLLKIIDIKKQDPAKMCGGVLVSGHPGIGTPF